jgi:Fe-S cluster biosynthesis and repair protein YggX
MSFIEEFGNKTIAELRSYAKKNNIDLYGTKTKRDILEVLVSFFPEEGKPEGYIPPSQSEEKIAIYSTKNLYWSNIGKVEKGYNIVTKEASEKWLTHKAVREATPEEVAKYYGK